MNLNFELIIFYGIVISGTLALIDKVFITNTAIKTNSTLCTAIFESARSFFPILIIVFFMRSFLFEPFRIPSGSLKPTLLVGDFILVNKFAYGLRLPVVHKKIVSIAEPKRGDIVVFREPSNPSMDLIKRVIGVPGDHISYINKTLYINGQKVSQQFEKFGMDQDNHLLPWVVEQKQENLLGVKHGIYEIPNQPEQDFFDVVVPAGKYFMMGDNRDDSADSRVWGFLPEENIIGKATRVLLSWDTIQHPFRWNRTGLKL